jgi:HAD superfamily hydrolase (TIGR01490 family)
MTRAAFFDMDRTVLAVDTGLLLAQHLYGLGQIGLLDVSRAIGWALRYKLGLLDMAAVARRVVAELMTGKAEAATIDEAERWYRAEIEAWIAPAAQATIAVHRACGDRLILLTSSPHYVAAPLAASVGFDDLLCSRLEVEAGHFTGRIIEPWCYGDGKVVWAERLAREKGIDLGASAFYTDSVHDLPMLERVGEPVAVNPDLRLARLARRRGWPVQLWGGHRKEAT